VDPSSALPVKAIFHGRELATNVRRERAVHARPILTLKVAMLRLPTR
jgi:hypothetical protein